MLQLFGLNIPQVFLIRWGLREREEPPELPALLEAIPSVMISS